MLIPKAGKHDLTGAVFLRHNLRGVVAVDIKTGKQIWKKPDLNRFGNYSNHPNAVAGSGVVAVASGDKLVGLSPATGQTLWETAALKGPAVAAGARIYTTYCTMAAGEGVVAAAPYWQGYDRAARRNIYETRLAVIDESTGRQVWAAKGAKGMPAGLLLTEGTLYFASYDNTRRKMVVDAYEVADGTKRFRADLAGVGYMQGLIHVRGDRLLVVGRSVVCCYDAATGKLKWRNSAGNNMNKLLAVDDSRVLVASYDYGRGGHSAKVVAWGTESGKRLWASQPVTGHFQRTNYQFTRMGFAPKASEDTSVAVLSNYDYRKRQQHTAAYDGKTGKLLWRSQTPRGSVLSPVLVGRKHAAAVVSAGGRIEHRIWNLKTGKLVDKSRTGFGYFTCQEGSILKVGHGTVERMSLAEDQAGK
jgi:outer membrane protein assembly factor BamB